MSPSVPVDSPSDESAVPTKKARRGKGSISSHVRGPKEGRKRPNSLGADDQPHDGNPNPPSQPNSVGGFTPHKHRQSSTAMAMAGPSGKMLLPRLLQPKSTTPDKKVSGKERTSHACDKCRKAKAKCSGGQPCEKCKMEGRECIYGDGKRDKTRKEMDRLAKENEELKKQSEDLVKFLQGIKDDPVVPEKTTDDIEEYLSTIQLISPNGDDGRRGSGDTGEDNADAQEVASMGSLDAINEDTNRDEEARAAGYLGKSSAVRWVQRTKDYLDENDESKGSQKDADEPNNAFMDATCHADDTDYPHIDKDSVNPYDMPPLQLAQTLVEAYFKHVHPALPILSELDFRKSFDKYIVHSPNRQRQIGEKQQNFLCSMNMVFAIAARHAQVTQADYRGVENDHLVYFARARAMGLDERALHKDAELENTTSLALVSLYFLTLESINRAWTWSGIALRSALTLGLHLRSQTRALSDVDKEYRIRIFWSCYCLERILNQLTGRPSCISPRDISTNIPLNIDEAHFQRGQDLYDEERNSKSDFYGASAEAAAKAVPPVPRSLPADSSRSEGDGSPMDTSPISKFSSVTSTTSGTQPSRRGPTDNSIASQEMTSMTYFIHRIRLSIISHEIFQDLYSPTMVKSKWGDVQDVIRKICGSLDEWRESMPWQYRFDPDNPRSSEPPEYKPGESVKNPQERRDQWKSYAGQRIGLAMMWNSSRMVLYRPTLCRISQEIQHESERSKGFNSEAASSCVQSARNMIACLPPLPDHHGKHSQSPRADDQFGSDVVGIHSFVPWWNTAHHIIEAGSVLIMESAYRADHVPSQAEALFEDTKTAVSWMRHLAPQSVMAKKGSVVYEVLLRRVAPRIGCDAGPLNKDGDLPRAHSSNRSNRSHGDGNDTSSDTIRWSGHNESAARFEHHPNLGSNQPNGDQQQQHQHQQSHGMPMAQPHNHLPHQQTTAPSPNTLFGQPTATMAGEPNDFSLGGIGLDALENFHFAGSVFGAYDQFGPWYNNSFDTFGIFDPVMNARIGADMEHLLSPPPQNHSPLGGNALTGNGSGPLGRAAMTAMDGHQQIRQHHQSPLGNVSNMAGGLPGGGQIGNQQMGGGQINHAPHPQMASHQISTPQMSSMGGMSTGISMPPVTAADVAMGRPFNYDTAQQHQQLPSMQQMGVGNVGGGSMQQGGGYPPSSMAWDGLLPPVNQQIPQHQGQQQPYQQGQHHNLPSLHGQGINVPHQGMNAPPNQGMGGQHGQHGQPTQHGHPGNTSDPRQGYR